MAGRLCLSADVLNATRGGVSWLTFEKTAMKSPAMAVSTMDLTDMMRSGEGGVGVESREPMVKTGEGKGRWCWNPTSLTGDCSDVPSPTPTSPAHNHHHNQSGTMMQSFRPTPQV